VRGQQGFAQAAVDVRRADGAEGAVEGERGAALGRGMSQPQPRLALRQYVLKRLERSSRVVVDSAGMTKIEHDSAGRRPGGVDAIDHRLHDVVRGAGGQLAGKPQADDVSRRRPAGGLALSFAAWRRAQPAEGTTPQEKRRMRNQHGTSPRRVGEAVIAGSNLETSLQERALTGPHSFWVNPGPVARGQRQPEVSEYRSQALFSGPIAGTVQSSAENGVTPSAGRLAVASGLPAGTLGADTCPFLLARGRAQSTITGRLFGKSRTSPARLGFRLPPGLRTIAFVLKSRRPACGFFVWESCHDFNQP